MSRAADRVLEAIDVGLQQAADLHHGARLPALAGKCWRCLTRPARSHEESLCDPCFEWCAGLSDRDPKRPNGGAPPNPVL